MNRIIDTIASLFPSTLHGRIFLVGGVVRDLLAGVEHTDIDLVAALTDEEFAANGFRIVDGKTTAPIWFRHDATLGTIEVTQLADVTELAADLQRRDFTANALALTLSGEIIDPMGGRADIQQKRLRSCTPQTFLDDPLRIFRALRFEADGWRMTPETADLIRRQDWANELTGIPVERFSREMIKAFGSQFPERFFERTLEFSVGRNLLPELFRMPQIPAGPLLHHPEGDLFTHSTQVLQRVVLVTDDSLTRFCAMFHDIGKLATQTALYPKHHGHDQAGFAMALEFCQRLRLPAHYGKALAWVSRLHGTFNKWAELRDATKLRLADQAIKAEIVDVLPVVAAADKAGGDKPEGWGEVVETAALSARDLGIDLVYLEQLPPGKRADFILQARIKKMGSTGTCQP